ncbi:DUF418 domain-containing protein [Paenibacillus lactis]|uniref:DUF418 domain-containing protein n=1 Tax=Paenibacillus lactis TaxID=228574 RepID=UPI0011A8D84D|nr:DUF418 domain-containing protein [Paenibacillus lactis]GIO92910.1 hypothetical protein J31TS3_41370 [Paenibacillus lactis]
MATVKNETVMKRQPATGTGRLQFLDQFRGFALLGLPFVNVLALWLIATPIVSLFYLSSLLMLGHIRIGAKVLHPLQAYGRMALTNYIGQTVFLVGIQRLILNGSPSTYVVSTLVSLGIVVFQIIISNLWMRWFQYGPLEWLWRCGTYWTLVPIRQKTGNPQA